MATQGNATPKADQPRVTAGSLKKDTTFQHYNTEYRILRRTVDRWVVVVVGMLEGGSNGFA
jgi:hypothetical protein